MPKDLIVLGCGKFSIDVADIATEIGGWRVAALVQNAAADESGDREGFPILWLEDALARFPMAHAVCALGSQERWKFIEQAAALGAKFATLVHPFTRVSPRTELAAGVIVAPGAVVAAGVHTGAHAIVNRASSIGHHTTIGDYAFLGPGSTICGSCTIGSRSFIGAGAVVSDHVQIGEDAFVCAGAVVTQDVEAGARVMGVPAKPR